jgi:LysM repeat protein
MNKQQHGPKVAAILLTAALFLSACTQSVSNAPLATATLITPTGLFVTPLTAENPMQMIEEFAQGTAAAQTAAAGGGTPTTPQVVATLETVTNTTPLTDITPLADTSETPATPTTSTIITVATTPVVTTQVTSIVGTPVIVGTVPTMGPKPTSYTLQKGEWPYCIARRFNVNPDELLTLSHLTSAQSNALMPGQVLTIPQTNNPFPSDRALHTHPTTYTVPSVDTTVYGVACYFGDVDPAQIAAANGIAVSAALTTGQKLAIP